MNIICHDFQYASTILETLKLNNYNDSVYLLSVQIPQIEINYGCDYTLLNPNTDIIDDKLPFIFGINDPFKKENIYNYLKSKTKLEIHNFTKIYHPSSVLMESVKIENGTTIDALSVISSYTKVGFGVTINRGVNIGHHCSIGNFSSIHAGVSIPSNVTIGNRTQISTGAVILPGVKIGNNTIIGAGSVVTKDIPDNVVAYGNPCKIIKINEL